MRMISKSILSALFMCFAAVIALDSCKQPNTAKPGTEYLERGSKIIINKDLSFVYDFNKNPAIGMFLVRIKVTDTANNNVDTLRITGQSGMPSMKDAHDSGEVEFQINKEGVYLLPVNIVMPGNWEVEVKVYKDKTRIFNGRIGINV